MTTCTTMCLWGYWSRFSNRCRERVLHWAEFLKLWILFGVWCQFWFWFFTDHEGNIMFIEIIPTKNNIIVIGRIDLNVRVWDIRSGNFPESCRPWILHQLSIVIPNINYFGTGSYGSTCIFIDKLFYG